MNDGALYQTLIVGWTVAGGALAAWLAYEFVGVLRRSIRPLSRMWQRAWWNWARRELTVRDPMHRDLPMIVRRCNELEAS